MKTNATRLLDALGYAYELRDYEVDVNDLSAVKVAGQIGLPPRQVFKTLCAKGDRRGHVFAVIPGDGELDLKALARATDNRSAELVPVSQLQQLTGYIRGGVTVLAAKKSFPVRLDESALAHAVIAVSAGVRGTQMLLAPADYMRATGAATAPLTRTFANDSK
jgi:Cys-tRNA(Pro)/Cys-tRNA(Cys) deacylase